jgi:hypothetical protein
MLQPLCSPPPARFQKTSYDKKLYCCKLRYVQQATCCKSCYHFNPKIFAFTQQTQFATLQEWHLPLDYNFHTPKQSFIFQRAAATTYTNSFKISKCTCSSRSVFLHYFQNKQQSLPKLNILIVLCNGDSVCFLTDRNRFHAISFKWTSRFKAVINYRNDRQLIVIV